MVIVESPKVALTAAKAPNVGNAAGGLLITAIEKFVELSEVQVDPELLDVYDTGVPEV